MTLSHDVLSGNSGSKNLPHPFVFIAAVTIVMIAGLWSRLSLPIGPGYWDISTYFDAAHRIVNGQIPNVDFQTPAGPLPYYLFACLNYLFPDAQPLLSTQWSIALIVIPLAAFLFHDVARSSRRNAFLLLVPFLCFLLLPLNTEALYPAPGFDGYGMYNRHPALLLYLLIVAMLFCKNRIRLYILIAVIMFTLFLFKITGFACGAVLIAYGLICRRVYLRSIILTAAATILAIAVLELATGMVSGYLQGILQLAAINSGSFRRRYLAFFGNHLNIFVPVIFAAAVFAISYYRRKAGAEVRDESHRMSSAELLDTGALWMIAILLASIIFEIQNTGSQEFIYIWPAALLTLNTMDDLGRRARILLIAGLTAACIPVITNIAQRAVQTILSSLSYQRLDADELGPLGRISARQIYFVRAAALNQHFQDARNSYRKLSQLKLAHSDILTAEPDFQIGWLVNTIAGVRALRGYEANSGRRFETLYTLDFTDPFPYLLGRRPVRFTQIGLDSQRTLPLDDKRMIASVASADAILIPLCPVTPMRDIIVARFAPALEGRDRISLTPCWDILIRRGSDFATVAGSVLN